MSGEPLTLNGSGIATDGALRNLSGANIWQSLVTLGSAARINSDAGTLTFDSVNSITGTNTDLTLGGAGHGTVGGSITTGTGTLTKDGAGIWTLSGANTFSGLTSLTAGTLAQSATGFLADNSALTVNGATAVFDLGANHHDTVATVTLDGGGTLNGSRLSTLTSTGSFEMKQGTVNARLAGSGIALNKTTANTVTLNGANTYTGLTTISAGTLEVAGGAAIADAGAVSIASVSGATLLVSSSETIGALSGGNGANGTGDLQANTLTAGDASTTTFGGTITGTGTGGLVKRGTGVLNLDTTGVLTFDKLIADDGTLNVNSALGTGSGTAVVAVNDTAGGAATKLRFGSVSQTLSSLSIGAGATVVFTSAVASGAFTGGSKAASIGGNSAVVPEPGTMGLLLVGALGLLNRRRAVYGKSRRAVCGKQ